MIGSSTSGADATGLAARALALGASRGLGIGLVAAGWLVLAWPWLAGGALVPWDAKTEFYPTVRFLSDAWHGGQSAFWNPFVWGGLPLVADPQSLIFQPLFAALAWLVERRRWPRSTASSCSTCSWPGSPCSLGSRSPAGTGWAACWRRSWRCSAAGRSPASCCTNGSPPSGPAPGCAAGCRRSPWRSPPPPPCCSCRCC